MDTICKISLTKIYNIIFLYQKYSKNQILEDILKI